MTEIEWLRDCALDLARKWHEVAVVVLAPPAGLVSGSVSTIPYATLLSQTSELELKTPGCVAYDDTGTEVHPATLRPGINGSMRS